MRTDNAVTRMSSEPVSVRPIVDRQMPVKILPSLAVDNQRSQVVNMMSQPLCSQVQEMQYKSVLALNRVNVKEI